MAIKTFKRYEKKYLLTEKQYAGIINIIKEHMDRDIYTKEEDAYTISNIYFDTKNNDVIKHSLLKPYAKEKLRLRAYGNNITKNSLVYIELKKKIGGIVSKRRVEMSLAQAEDFLNHGKIPTNLQAIDKQVINEIQSFRQTYIVKEAVYIGYEREAYFAKEDKNFRLTFDSKIISRREDLNFESGFFGKEIIPNNQKLMEVKIQGAVPMWFARALSQNKIYPQSFSKYGKEYKEFVKMNIGNGKEQTNGNIIYIPNNRGFDFRDNTFSNAISTRIRASY